MNKLLILISIILAFTANAHAGIMVVEPDDFADGQDISNPMLGVALQLESGLPVYAYDTLEPDYASTGTKVFGYDAGFGVEPYWDDANVFRATFSALSKYVAIDVVNNDGQGSDNAFMEVFGSGGLLTTIYSSTIDFPGFQTLSFRSESAEISYIRMSSSDGSDFNLDRLQFEVPEPSTLALMGIGALGFSVRRKKAGSPRIDG